MFAVGFGILFVVDLMRFEFCPYRRRFRQPLRTSHGLWSVREGIIVRLESELGRVGFGEIAPIEWFGTETMEDAIALCQTLPSEISWQEIDQIQFPACRFGFEMGWLAADGVADVADERLVYCALISEEWRELWEQGYRTFKIKIGVNEIREEITTLKRLVEEMPEEAVFRLDANGGLTEFEMHQWLAICEHLNVEFLEQPTNDFAMMLSASQQYSTAIALDESVATIAQLEDCYERGWRGIFVIKPAIAGSPSRLRKFCEMHQIDTVFSSVFETAIARRAGLKLAAELSDRAVGYGTTHWFDELTTNDFDELWNSL